MDKNIKPQKVYWAVNTGHPAGVFIIEGTEKIFMPWQEIKKEIEKIINVGNTLQLADFHGKKDWLVEIHDSDNKKIGDVWFGGDPESDWQQDGLIRTGLAITDDKWTVWQVFQRYSDGSYKLIKSNI